MRAANGLAVRIVEGQDGVVLKAVERNTDAKVGLLDGAEAIEIGVREAGSLSDRTVAVAAANRDLSRHDAIVKNVAQLVGAVEQVVRFRFPVVDFGVRDRIQRAERQLVIGLDI